MHVKHGRPLYTSYTVNLCIVSVFYSVGCVKQCRSRCPSSPPLTSCCSPSDSRKETRASEDSSRPFLLRVCVCVCEKDRRRNRGCIVWSLWFFCANKSKLLDVLSHPLSFLYLFFSISPECLSVIEIPKALSEAGEMTSPFYPSLLPPICSCTWRLQVCHHNKRFIMHIWCLLVESGKTEVVFSFQTHSSSLGVALKFKNYILSPKDLTPCEHGWWKVKEIMWVVVHECNDDEAGAPND